jgi:hypothetical protein
VPSPVSPNATAALRRFTAVWTASVVVKVVALAVLLFLVLKLFGGF